MQTKALLEGSGEKRERKELDNRNGVLVTSNSQMVGMFFVEES